jgi:hypothetical protein
MGASSPFGHAARRDLPTRGRTGRRLISIHIARRAEAIDPHADRRERDEGEHRQQHDGAGQNPERDHVALHVAPSSGERRGIVGK